MFFQTKLTVSSNISKTHVGTVEDVFLQHNHVSVLHVEYVHVPGWVYANLIKEKNCLERHMVIS